MKSEEAQRIAEDGIVLRAVVGSTVHGLGVANQDDRDEMGVCIEPPDCVVGLNQFEQWVYRTQPEGVRSRPGDLDLTIYSLRKYVRLAEQGNPSILLLMWVPDKHVITINAVGRMLRDKRDLFVSRQAGHRFLGYLTAQKQRLLGERGQKNVQRPELVEAYGYDTKYAGHMLRLGYQGIEFLQYGTLTLPMAEPIRQSILDVREGRVPLNDVLSEVGELEALLEGMLDDSWIPEKPNRARVNALLWDCYMEGWMIA